MNETLDGLATSAALVEEQGGEPLEVAAFDPDKPAGLGEDPVDKVMEPIVKEVEQKAAEWLAHLACGIDKDNSAAVLDTIKQVAGLLSDILMALDPGAKKFDGQFGGSMGTVMPGIVGSAGPSNVETFGASMMEQLSDVLKMQYGPKPVKHDVSKLMTAIEQAKKHGLADVAEKLQKKLDEVLASDDYAVDDPDSPRIALPSARLPPELSEKLDDIEEQEKEVEDAE